MDINDINLTLEMEEVVFFEAFGRFKAPKVSQGKLRDAKRWKDHRSDDLRILQKSMG